MTENQGLQFKRERFHHKTSSFSKGMPGLTEDRTGFLRRQTINQGMSGHGHLRGALRFLTQWEVEVKDYCFPSNSKILLVSSISLPPHPLHFWSLLSLWSPEKQLLQATKKTHKETGATRVSGSYTRLVLLQKISSCRSLPCHFHCFLTFLGETLTIHT